MDKIVEGFSLGLFIWQAVLFIVLLLLLRIFAWKPIMNAIETREETIKGSLDAAEEAKRQVAELQASNESLLKEARAERDALLKEARDTKDKMIAEAKNQAKTEAERITASAREAIRNEKNAALTELKNQVAALSIEIAEKILKEELSSQEKQKTLANNLVEDMNLN